MHEEPGRIVDSDGIRTHLNIDTSLQASVLRALTGTTPHDAQVDARPLPLGPFWLRQCIRLLKWYRRRLSPRLGDRCVYEPSCSRYSELALTQYGFFKGSLLTVKRLRRCRPGNGGIDLP